MRTCSRTTSLRPLPQWLSWAAALAVIVPADIPAGHGPAGPLSRLLESGAAASHRAGLFLTGFWFAPGSDGSGGGGFTAVAVEVSVRSARASRKSRAGLAPMYPGGGAPPAAIPMRSDWAARRAR
jgi:hypothetical protein